MNTALLGVGRWTGARMAAVSRSSAVQPLMLMLCYGAYLLFAAQSITQPITYDEVRNLFGARMLDHAGDPLPFGQDAVWSRPLYMVLLAAILRIGQSETVVRLIGVISVAVTLILLYRFAQMRAQEGSGHAVLMPFLAGALLVTHPAVIQGSLLIDTDPTVLMVASACLVFTFAEGLITGREPSSVRLGVLFALALGAKITTPWLLIIAMGLFLLLNGEGGKGLRRVGLVAAIGLACFAIMWLVVASMWRSPASAQLDYFVSGATSYGAHPPYDPMQMAVALARFTLWTSPFLLVLGALAIGRLIASRKRDFKTPEQFAAVCIVVVLIGTIVLGGAPFGFPKYQLPIFPLLVFLVASDLGSHLLLTRKDFYLGGALLLAGIAYFLTVVGDPIMTLNYELRDALANRPSMVDAAMRHLLLQMIGSVAFVFFAVLAIRFVKRGRLLDAVRFALVIGLFAANLALDVTQARADYLTRYFYGVRGTAEVVDYLKRHIERGDRLLATREFLFYYLGGDHPDVQDRVWRDPELFLQALQNPDVRGALLSIGHHETDYFRRVFHDPRVEAALQRDFQERRIGSYTLWMRKAGTMREASPHGGEEP